MYTEHCHCTRAILRTAHISTLGVNQWAAKEKELVQQGFELEHFSTCWTPNGGVMYSGVFVERGIPLE